MIEKKTSKFSITPLSEKKKKSFICFFQLTVNEKLFLSLLAGLRSKRF